MKPDVESLSEVLVAKVKHYLITMMGRSPEEANIDEFYRALCYSLREEIMINWAAATQTRQQKDVRMVYYLSMEYLPGRILSNNITSLHQSELVRLVMVKMNRNLSEIINCESDPGLGNGGLGRLASCFLDSLATLSYPAMAYGLRYQYGTFEQQIWNGLQVEAPDVWLLHANPWEFRQDLRNVSIKYCGFSSSSKNIHGDEILFLNDYESVSAFPYDYPIIGYGKENGQLKFSVVTLRLWSTKESPTNFQLQRYNAGRLDQASENTTLTDVLYPSDYHETGKRIRLKQEFLLVSASLQDIINQYHQNHNNFRAFVDKVRIQINDTHAVLAIPELVRILTKNYDIPWKVAVDIVFKCTGYTNHTILKEALEEWDQPLFQYLLPRQYQIIERLNQDFCNTLRSTYPGDEEKIRRLSILESGRIRMANLAIVGSHKINGVAALHTEILKKTVFKDFYELFPDRFINITNGVTQRRWLLHCNPELAKFITKRIGEGWITDFSLIGLLRKFASDHGSQQEFLSIKKKNKLRLIEFITHSNKLRNNHGEFNVYTPYVDVNSLFDVQIKRIHEYKRQLLNILHTIMLWQEMRDNPGHHRIKRTVIIGGKAAAGYETAKDIIQLIYCVGRKINSDPLVNNQLKVIFIENYNVSKAEIIIPAAELSEQISTAGTEASGTGNMKLSMNGALTIGTDDGANIEMRQEVTDEWWPFVFGCSADEIHEMKKNNSYDSQEIYENNPRIKSAVDTLIDHTFADNETEHLAFSDLHHQLIKSHYGGEADRYFVIKDLEDYYETQKKVEELYSDQYKWAEYAINNIAGMGQFSTDRSIQEYSQKIWNIDPCPVDNAILERIQHDYESVDQCRIF